MIPLLWVFVFFLMKGSALLLKRKLFALVGGEKERSVSVSVTRRIKALKVSSCLLCAWIILYLCAHKAPGMNLAW
jgi:hypothetical protein